MLAELQEAAQQGAKANVHRLCVQLARNGRGVKLHSHSSFIPFDGRGEKLVGVTAGGEWDVCENSS